MFSSSWLLCSIDTQTSSRQWNKSNHVSIYGLRLHFLTDMSQAERPPLAPVRSDDTTNNTNGTSGSSYFLLHLSTRREQQKSDILSSVQSMVKDKLENFQEQISSDILESQQEVTRTVQDNLDQRDLFTFKRKSNERQFKFNKSIINRATQALSAVTSKEFSKAAGILQEGITELEGRQKLLKIADN